MKEEKKLLFFDISNDLEILPENELFKIKGGNSDIAWENEMDPIDIPPPDGGDPDPGDDPGDDWGDDPWDNEWDEDWDEDWGGGYDPGNDPPPEEEDECTCEASTPASKNPGIKDPDNIISNLGADVVSNMKYLVDNKDTLIQNQTITQQGLDRMLNTYDKVINMMSALDESRYSFRIEYGSLNTVPGQAGGSFHKEANGEYVITIDPSNLPSTGVNGLIIHELYHAYQMLSGNVGFDNTGNPTMIGMEDEIAAYQLQYDFDAGAANTPKVATEAGIKADYPNIYNNLPSQGGKCAVHG